MAMLNNQKVYTIVPTYIYIYTCVLYIYTHICAHVILTSLTHVLVVLSLFFRVNGDGIRCLR